MGRCAMSAAPVQCVHHKHIPGTPTPVQSCAATRYTVLAPAPADPEPIELQTVTRYVVLDNTYSCPPVYHTDASYPGMFGGESYYPGGGYVGVPIGVPHMRAPELDPSNALGGITMLALLITIIRSRK
jgi:hypothetical protein